MQSRSLIEYLFTITYRLEDYRHTRKNYSSDVIVQAFDKNEAVKNLKDYIRFNLTSNFLISEPVVIQYNTMGIAVIETTSYGEE